MAIDERALEFLRKQGYKFPGDVAAPAMEVIPPADKPPTMDQFLPATPPSFDVASAPKEVPAAAPAPAMPPIPAVDNTIPPAPQRPPIGWGEALGQALAGYGDAMLARTGRSGSALKNTIAAKQASDQMGMEDQQREIERKKQERGLQVKAVQDASARNLLAKFTGKKPEEFAGMDADTIAKMEPLIGKILAQQHKPEGLYNRDPKSGKVYLDGKEVPGTSVPAGAKVENLADKSVMIGEKEEQLAKNRLSKLSDSLDPSKQRQGAFGISKQGFDRAERLESLALAVPAGQLDSRQIEELAIGLNAMLSGSSVGAQSQVEALVPKSALGNAMKLKEWLMNEPTGLKQQKFVKRMLDSIAREKSTFADQILRTQKSRIAPYADLENSHPDAFESVLRSNGVDPDEWKKWKKEGYKKTSAVQRPEGKEKTAGMTDDDLIAQARGK